MKKLFFILALLNVAYGQTLWKLVTSDILPYNRTHRLYLPSGLLVEDTLQAETVYAIAVTASLGNLKTGLPSVNDGYVFFYNAGSSKYIALGGSASGTDKEIVLPNKNGTVELREKNIVTVTANHTVQDSNDVVLVSCSTANITITLPAAASYQGRVFHIKKIDATGYSVIIDGNGAETIDGNTTITFSGQYTSYTIISNGTNWYIL